MYIKFSLVKESQNIKDYAIYQINYSTGKKERKDKNGNTLKMNSDDFMKKNLI